MGNLFKQPNGNFCEINSRGEMVFCDYTEQDIVDMCVAKIKEDIKQARPFEELIKEIVFWEKPDREKLVSEAQFELMGFNKSYNETLKYVPRKPIDTNYASCNFATYGKCPNCGRTVQDGMGHTDEKCRCGQLLNWENT